MYTINRYHDISCGHRVVGHEGKCRFLHGHNYRVHFTCVAEKLDAVGRVIDFGDVKSRLCMWLEDNWDHKFLAWDCDDEMQAVQTLMFEDSIVFVPFNPTAENIAEHLVNVIGPEQLAGTGITLLCARVDETRKCSASYQLPNCGMLT